MTAVKDLEYYLRTSFTDADRKAHVSLLEREHPDARITRQEVDTLARFPAATELSVNGLTQETFEHLISEYGRQFKVINFWKCPLVHDLTPLGSLQGIEYITWFWNQRAEAMWDFAGNTSLKGLGFDDFTRLHDLSELAGAPALRELHFGDKIWNKYVLNTLEPVGRCARLKSLTFSAKKIADGRIEPLAHLTQLEHLEFPAYQFTTRQVAWLKARLPASIESRVLAGHWRIDKPLQHKGKNKDTIIVGKGKVRLVDSEKDRALLERHIDEFNAMHRWFLEHSEALPDDYGAA